MACTGESSPLRILQLTPYYQGAWAYGGIPRVVQGLSEELHRRGHQVTVCTTDVADAHTRARLEPSSPGGPTVERFANISNRLAYHLQAFAPRGMDGWLRRNLGSFQIAHLHGCRHLPGVLAARHLARASIPYVLSPHGTSPLLERRRGLKWLFDATVGRQVLRDPAHWVAVSQAEHAQLLHRRIGPSQLSIVPNGLDLAEFEPRPDAQNFRRRWGLGDARLVVFLGKLTPRKQVPLLVDALADLADPTLKLVIAGNDLGSGEEIKRRVAARGLKDDQVVFTGLLTGRERLEALAAAAVVAYPGTDEVFGLVALEALLCGAPVVVADDSGCGMLIDALGGGLCVPPRSRKALTEALRELLAHPERHPTGPAADRVREEYGLAPLAEKMEQVYRQVLEGRER